VEVAREYRAFKKEFVTVMRVATAWPDQTMIQTWIRARGSIRTGAYRQLQMGRGIIVRSVRYVVQALLEMDERYSSELTRTRLIIFDFIKGQGVSDPGSLKTDAIMDYLCEPITNRPVDSVTDRTDDIFMRGLSAFLDVLCTKRAVNLHAQRCVTESQVKMGHRWVGVTCGRMLAPECAHLSPEDAIAGIERHFGNGFTNELSEELFVRLSRIHPWVAVFARGRDSPTGMSVMLPLTEAAYLRYINGERSCFEFHEDDFTIPSRHLFVMAVAERPHDLGGDPTKDATMSLLACCLAQAAVLTRCSTARDKTMHFLSFGATPVSTRRLEAQSYRPIGRNMKGTNLPLMERTLTPTWSFGIDMAAAVTLHYLSDRIMGPPEP
jgi:hypothetical protein